MIANDIRESLKLTCKTLNEHSVEYMIVGGVAVGFYGYQRISGGFLSGTPEIKHDLDFWYNPTASNFYKLVDALKELGIDVTELEKLVFDPKKSFLRVPHKTFKTEFLAQMSGLQSFSKCLMNTRKITLDGNNLNIIGYSDLIKNKKAVDRDIDRKDIRELKRINKDSG